jgi:hypothetical protein
VSGSGPPRPISRPHTPTSTSPAPALGPSMAVSRVPKPVSGPRIPNGGRLRLAATPVRQHDGATGSPTLGATSC